jgi:diguanylate cyclase (GGDEF)-like protein
MVMSLPRVLVVEDDAAIRSLLGIALRRKSLSVDCVVDGIAALAELDTTRYTVLLVDLMLPRMNGFAFLEAFAQLSLSPQPIVFVMTAYDDAAFSHLDSNIVHGFFRKPFDVEAVAQTVADCAQLLQEAHAVDSRRRRIPERGDEAPLRALIADSDPEYRDWLGELTRRLGCSVDLVRDGAMAVEQLARHDYDIAILDQDMPQLTGLDVIARIRADDATAALYTLMLTAQDDFDAKLRALTAGFDDFLSKSSPEAEITARINVARRIATRQRAMSMAASELRGLATRDDLTGVFNRRVFLAETERMLALGAVLNIVLFDLDDFKTINDTYGHLIGDRVLCDVGAAFHRGTRPEDLIARYGGDEFVMIVPDLDLASIERMAQRLADEVRALQWRDEETQTFTVGVTVGVASSRLLAEPTVEQLLDAADRDLYKNKWMRRNPTLNPDLYEYPPITTGIDTVKPIRETPFIPLSHKRFETNGPT